MLWLSGAAGRAAVVKVVAAALGKETEAPSPLGIRLLRRGCNNRLSLDGFLLVVVVTAPLPVCVSEGSMADSSAAVWP